MGEVNTEQALRPPGEKPDAIEQRVRRHARRAAAPAPWLGHAGRRGDGGRCSGQGIERIEWLHGVLWGFG